MSGSHASSKAGLPDCNGIEIPIDVVAWNTVAHDHRRRLLDVDRLLNVRRLLNVHRCWSYCTSSTRDRTCCPDTQQSPSQTIGNSRTVPSASIGARLIAARGVMVPAPSAVGLSEERS
jgi:hypothetical protein